MRGWLLRPISGLPRAAYLAAAGLLLLYFAYLTQTYYWDGVLFSINIELAQRGEIPPSALFHPNHLLYSAAGYGLYSAALGAGLHMRAITVLQICNAIGSVASAGLIYLLAKRLTRSQETALFSALLFATGANWWKYSTDADAYIICILLLLAASLFLFDDPPKLIPAGACHVAAMLFHELAIFLYVPVILTIGLDRRRSTRARLESAVAYALISGICVAGAYELCYAHADYRAYPSLLRWVSSYDTSNTKFTHSARDIGTYFSGYLKLFVGGRLSLIANYVSPAMVVSFCIACGALAYAVWLWRHPQSAAEGAVEARHKAILWTWLLGYAVFLASWDPGSAFHKLFAWPPIVLLIGTWVAERPALRNRIRALIFIVLAMSAWNFGAFIYPHSQPTADPVLALAKRIDRELPRSATVYYAAPNADSWYLEYFAPGRRWILLPRDQRADRQIIQSTAAPVCLDTTALNEFGSDLQPDEKWDLVNANHNVRLECRTAR